MPIPPYIDQSRSLLVGPQNASDNAVINLRGGKLGEGIFAELYGKYGELTQRGLVYAARVATAAAIPINTTLTNAPTLWNPSDSQKMVLPLKILISVAAIGTPVLTSLTLSYLTGAGTAIGTGAPVVTFTNIVPVNVLLGRGPVATTKFSGATVTFTAQPAAFMDLGIVHWLEGTSATGAMLPIVYDFDSALLLPPGALIAVGAIAATSTTFHTTILFAELPMVAV